MIQTRKIFPNAVLLSILITVLSAFLLLTACSKKEEEPAPWTPAEPQTGITTYSDTLPMDWENVTFILFKLDGQRKVIFGRNHFTPDGDILFTDVFSFQPVFLYDASAGKADSDPVGLLKDEQITDMQYMSPEEYYENTDVIFERFSIRTFRDFRILYEITIPEDEWVVLPMIDFVLD
ncbi:MAG: hypothetical protein R6W96_01655 [Clostridia bacterium]